MNPTAKLYQIIDIYEILEYIQSVDMEKQQHQENTFINLGNNWFAF